MGERSKASNRTLDRYPGSTGGHRPYSPGRHRHLALADTGSSNWLSVNHDRSDDTPYTSWRVSQFKHQPGFAATGRVRGSRTFCGGAIVGFCWGIGCGGRIDAIARETGWGARATARVARTILRSDSRNPRIVRATL